MIKFLKSKIRLVITKFKYKNAVIHDRVYVSNSCSLADSVVVFQSTTLINVTVGCFSYIQKNSEVVNAKIGKFCSIAGNVHIGVAEHPTHFISTNPVFYDNTQPLPCFFINTKNHISKAKETVVGNDVWIGQGVIIKSGVNVGTGAIIGAGSVVVKDVEPYSIVAGTPAKHIKWRFENDIREGLLKSEWWNFSDDKIRSLNEYFDRPDDFLKNIDKLREYKS